MLLVINKPQDATQFVDKEFSVTGKLLNADCLDYKGPQLLMDVSLFILPDLTTAHNTDLDVLDEPIISGNGVFDFRVKFKVLSMDRQNSRFMLCLRVPSNPNIKPAYTTEMVSVRYRLALRPLTTATNNQSVAGETGQSGSDPLVWYKDKGGKDNCIEVSVYLVDMNNTQITDRRVPLRAVLFYGNGQSVPDQAILSLHHMSRMTIYGNEDASVKLRISEVSTRHRGQFFRVKFIPDLSSGAHNADIGSVQTCEIDVKSKLNNYKRRREAYEDRGVHDSSGDNGYSYSEAEAQVHSSSHSHGIPTATIVPLAPQQATVPPPTSNVMYHQRSLVPCSTPEVKAALDDVENWSKCVLTGLDRLMWRPLNNRSDYNAIMNPNNTINQLVQLYNQTSRSFGILRRVVDTGSMDQGNSEMGDGNQLSESQPVNARYVPLRDGQSSTWDRPNLMRNNSLYLCDVAFPTLGNPSPSINSEYFESYKPEETRVHYIYAHNLYMVNGRIGIATFDVHETLIGMLVDVDGYSYRDASRIEFVVVDPSQHGDDLHRIQQEFREALSRQKSSVNSTSTNTSSSSVEKNVIITTGISDPNYESVKETVFIEAYKALTSFETNSNNNDTDSPRENSSETSYY